MAYKLQTTEQADHDIREIIEYMVVQLTAPKAAIVFKQKLLACYHLLKDHPLLFALCPDETLAKLGYRFVPVKNYILFYRVDEDTKTVYISRVVYGKRKYSELL